MGAGGPPPRSISAAGYLAYLYGLFGIVAGLAGALTFIPYRYESTFNAGYAELFTAVSAAGILVSAGGVLAGWGLFRARGWAWSLAFGVAAGCIALNALLVPFWTGYSSFAVFVGITYGLEVALLLVGRAKYFASVTGPPSGGQIARRVPSG